jgi:hypothetical protein
VPAPPRARISTSCSRAAAGWPCSTRLCPM